MDEVKLIVGQQTESVKQTESKFEGISEATNLVGNAVEKLNHSAELMLNRVLIPISKRYGRRIFT